jgi:hypothetical protein
MRDQSDSAKRTVHDHTTTPGLSAQIEAMDKLGFMLGRWRGVGWTMLEHGRAEFEQEESVRSLLSGEIVTVEGRANDPGNRDDIRFTAFAIAGYDPEAQAYSWRAYSAGNCVEVPLHVGDQTYRWEFEAAPDVLIRFDGTIAAGVWKEVGLLSADAGNSWSQTFEMNLTNCG